MIHVNLDIETIPQQPEEQIKARIAETIKPPGTIKKPETIKAWMEGIGDYAGVREALIDEQYHKTGLDGGRGHIICVTLSFGDSADLYTYFVTPPAGQPSDASAALEKHPERAVALLINEKTLGQPIELVTSEQYLLRNLFMDIRTELEGAPPFYIGHNISFDLRFLYHRSVVHGIDPRIPLYQDKKHGFHFWDTMEAWVGFRNYISQDALCEILGIDGKGMELTGDKVWEYYKAGRHCEIIGKNRHDVRQVRQIYKRQNYL